MLRFDKTKVAKEEFYGGKKKLIGIWDVNVDNVIISKSVKMKKNFNSRVILCKKTVKP